MNKYVGLMMIGVVIVVMSAIGALTFAESNYNLAAVCCCIYFWGLVFCIFAGIKASIEEDRKGRN